MTYTKKTGRLILLFLLLFLTGCDLSPGGKVLSQTETLDKTKENVSVIEESSTDAEKETAGQIWVHVCGEVKNPGVYSLSAGSRVFDAIEAAGGLTKKADENSLNLAASLEDESKVYVGSKEEGQSNENDKSVSDGKVNLNTASLEELMTLPGIGEVKAQAILDFRQQNGGFQKIEDLLSVDGIKEGTFQKLEAFITV